jgi:hypothetical protein
VYQVWLAASSPDGSAEMTEEYCSEVLEPYEFTEVARHYATPGNSAAKGLWMKVFCHSKPTPTHWLSFRQTSF